MSAPGPLYTAAEQQSIFIASQKGGINQLSPGQLPPALDAEGYLAVHDAGLSSRLPATLDAGSLRVHEEGTVTIEDTAGTATLTFNALWPGRSWVSSPIDASRWARVSGTIAFLLASSTTGTFKLQVSDDPTNPAAWADLSGATVSATAALNTAGFLLPSTTITARWVRGVWLSGQAVQQRITCVADVSGSLAGKYFLVSSSMSSTFPFGTTQATPSGNAYAVWFKVSGVGVSPGIITSADGIQYMPLEVDIATNDTAATVAVAVNTALTSARMGVTVSADAGQTWTPRAIMVAGGLFAHGGGLFVAVANGRAWQSVDGTNWTTNTTGTPNATINDITFGNGLFVAASNAGNVWTSPDGVTWTSRATGMGSANVLAVLWNGTVFAAMPGSGTTGAKSSDGTVWNTVTVVGGANNRSITWNGAYFVSTPASGTSGQSSSDATAWTPRTVVSNTSSLASKPNGIIVGTIGGTSNVAVSTDNGATWSTLTGVLQATGSSVVWDTASSQFMLNASGVMHVSPDGLAWTPYLNNTAGTAVSGGPTLLAARSSTADFTSLGVVGAVVSFAVAAANGAVPAQAGTSGFTVDQALPAATQAITASVYGT